MTALTVREEEVACLLGKGMTCRAVAETLCITVLTVRKHRTNIARKLAPRSAAQLGVFCVKTHGAALGTPAQPQHLPSVPLHLAALLGKREIQIAQLVTWGMTSKEIARVLSISSRTVSKHRQNTMRKLHVHGMTELMYFFQLLNSFN